MTGLVARLASSLLARRACAQGLVPPCGIPWSLARPFGAASSSKQPEELAYLATAMDDLMSAWARTKATYVFARMGIPDLLSESGPGKSAEQLAAEAQAHPERLYRILRLCGKLGLVTEHKNHNFTLTPMGRLFKEDHFSGMKHVAMTWNLPIQGNATNYLYEAAKTGEPGLFFSPNTKGQSDLFAQLLADPLEDKTFMKVLAANSAATAPVVLSYDFSRCRKVVDVGGNTGALLRHILKKHPGVKAVNFDLPTVLEHIPPIESEFQGRLECCGGDFFKPLPPATHGADAIVMKFIMHDWSDEHCIKILKNCKDALAQGGQIVIIDTVLPATSSKLESEPLSMAKLAMDMMMMAVCQGGCERTLKQWQHLLAAAGLKEPKVLHPPGNFLTSCIVTSPL